MNEIILYKSRLKAFRLIAVSSIFVIPSLFFIISQDDPKFIFWICTGFFSIGYAVAFINIFDKKPQIIINSKGIWDRSLKFETILWDDILDAYSVNIRREKFIALVVKPEIVKRKKLYKWAESINRFAGAQKINLYSGNVKVDNNKLLSAIKQLSNEKPENRSSIISKLNLK